MAGHAVTAARVDYCARALLKGHSGCRVVADLAAREGISRRSARRYVAKGYEVIIDDMKEINIDRQHVTAQTIVMLQEGMAKALEHNHVSAMVGACREMRELLSLADKNAQRR